VAAGSLVFLQRLHRGYGRWKDTWFRVSTIEQKKKGLGVRVRIRDVREFAKRCGIAIDRIYKDEGESGVVENRTQVEKLSRACDRGKVGVVTIPSLDRLSRNDLLALLD